LYDTVTIYVNNGGLKILGKDTIKICKGETTTLNTQKTSSFPGILTWKTAKLEEIVSKDSITGIIVLKKQVSGNVIATYAVGNCEFKDTVYFKVDSLPSLPIAAIKPENPHCKGELITLISPNVITPFFPNIKYLWTSQLGAVTPITNQNLAFYADKTLNYIRVTTNGLCKRSDTINIVVLDVTLNVSVKDTTVCEGTKFKVSIDAKGQKLTDIKWTPEDGLSCKDCINPTVTASNTTTYNVVATVEGKCPTSASFKVTVPKPIITIGPNPAILCKGASLQLDVKNFNTITNFKWTSAPDPISTGLQNPVIKVAGTYEVSGIVNGCPAQGSINVQLVDPKISIVPQNPTICPNGGTVQLAAAGVDKNITWTPSVGLNNATITNPIASQAGTYTMSGTLQGCPANASVTVKVEQVPVLTISPLNPTICPGGEVELTASGSNNNDYSWSPVGAFVVANGAVVKAKSAGILSVKATFGVNKCPQTASINVTTKTEDLISNATASPLSVLLPNGSNVVLNVSSSVNNLNYVWTNGGQQLGNTQKIDVSNSNIVKGKNVFTVTATNPINKCTDVETVFVTGFNAQLPLAFNPNSPDEQNRVFNVTGATDLDIIAFNVYNRWGNNVYSKTSDDPVGAGWNGQMNNKGDEQPSDTYLYIIQFKPKAGGDAITYKGDVTLLR
jgi:gliding motility-associated-like protein